MCSLQIALCYLLFAVCCLLLAICYVLFGIAVQDMNLQGRNIIGRSIFPRFFICPIVPDFLVFSLKWICWRFPKSISLNGTPAFSQGILCLRRAYLRDKPSGSRGSCRTRAILVWNHWGDCSSEPPYHVIDFDRIEQEFNMILIGLDVVWNMGFNMLLTMGFNIMLNVGCNVTT